MPTNTERLVAPGPSYLRPIQLQPGSPRLAGISLPQTMVDGWWVALLWCEEDGKLLVFSDMAPDYGTPPGSPLMRLGPGLSGALSGLVMEEGGRQQLRLRLGQPPSDEDAPWESPLAVVAGFRFEPARALAMRDNELAGTVLKAFVEAVYRLSY